MKPTVEHHSIAKKSPSDDHLWHIEQHVNQGQYKTNPETDRVTGTDRAHGPTQDCLVTATT